VDTFFVRTGDVLSAGLVYAGTTWLALSVPGFALTNVVPTMAWIGLAVRLLREHRPIVAQAQRTEAP
jgi:AAA family ATP:ADP antiporter